MDNLADFDLFFSGYLACAKWSSALYIEDTDGNLISDDNLEGYYFSDEVLKALTEECCTFYKEYYDLILEFIDKAGTNMAGAGHDFWLTRNGHGAGFWDRGAGIVGEILTDHADVYGGVDLGLDENGDIIII